MKPREITERVILIVSVVLMAISFIRQDVCSLILSTASALVARDELLKE